jgi:hypothetical protein
MNRMSGTRGGFRLPTAVTPIADESLASLLVRNAEMFRFRAPLRVLSRIGVRGRSIVDLLLNPPAPEVVASMATLLGVETSEIQRMAPWGPSKTESAVLGVPVPTRFLKLSNRRVCPECLQDSLHHRAWWDIAALTCCPIHKRPLLKRCPGCGGVMRWKGYRFYHCGAAACRFDLRKTVHDGPSADWAHITGLLELLTAHPSARLPGSGFAFGEALEASYIVGQMLRTDRMPKRTSRFLLTGGEDVAWVMEAGWSALVDWPVKFERALSAMRERAGGRGGRYGLRREFGKLPRWFATGGSAPWAAPLRGAFADFVAKQDDLRPKNSSRRKLGLPVIAERRHLTKREAADMLGINMATLDAVADREDLYLVRTSGTGAPSLLRLDRVWALREQDQARLTKGDAAKALGVGRPVVLELLERGFLREVPMNVRVDYRRSIPKQSLWDLIQRMRTRMLQGGDGVQLVSLSLAGRTRCTIADLVEAVLANRLTPRGIMENEVGIGALMFDPDEVGAAIRANQSTMSVAEAATELGVDEKNLRVWIRAGLIQAPLGSGPGQRGRRITSDELAEFRTRYVTVTEISKLVGFWSWGVMVRMEALGILTLAPAAKTAIYPREVLTEELMRLIKR